MYSDKKRQSLRDETKLELQPDSHKKRVENSPGVGRKKRRRLTWVETRWRHKATKPKVQVEIVNKTKASGKVNNS